MRQVNWNEKVGPKDWRWALAEETCKDIARSIPGHMEDRPGHRAAERREILYQFGLEPAQFISGYGVSPPWVVNPRTDRVIAYHGFQGSWVGWDRGGPVIQLAFTDVVKFLRREM